MTTSRPHVLADATSLASAAAGEVAARAEAAIRSRGAFRLAVPGGRSVRDLLATLAAPALAAAIDWPRVELLFADERAVPPDHAESNFRLVRDTLLAPLGARAPGVRRMPADAADLDAAALQYEPALVERLDLLVLGVGEDGHVASLFPGSPLLDERDRRVAAVFDSPKPPARRLTLTPRAIAEARGVMAIASGTGKAEAVAAALAPGAVPSRVPASLVRAGDWWLDRDAASRLSAAPNTSV